MRAWFLETLQVVLGSRVGALQAVLTLPEAIQGGDLSLGVLVFLHCFVFGYLQAV